MASTPIKNLGDHQLIAEFANGFDRCQVRARNKRVAKENRTLPTPSKHLLPTRGCNRICTYTDMTCVTVMSQEITNTTNFFCSSIITRPASNFQSSLKKLYITCAIFLMLHQSFLKRRAELVNFLVYWNKQLCFLHTRGTIFCLVAEVQNRFKLIIQGIA